MSGAFTGFLSRQLARLRADLDWLHRDDEDAARLRARHLNYVNRLTPLLAAVGLASTSLLAFVMRHSTGPVFLWGWLALSLVWSVLAMRGWWLRHRHEAQSASPRAVRRVTQGAVAMAMVWGLAALVWFPIGDGEQRFLVGMVVLGSLNGGVLALATVPPAAWSYLVIMTLASMVAVRMGNLGYLEIMLTFLTIYGGAQAWMALVISRIFSARVRSENVARERQADLDVARDQLISSEKMAALGGLVAGVSHEVNTPLGVSITAASAVREGLVAMRTDYQSQRMTRDSFEQALEQAMEGLDMLDTNLLRASRLIKDFKQTAVHQTSERLCDFDVMETLRALLASLHPVTRRVPVRPMLGGPRKLPARGYPGALMQVLTNLIMNSVNHAFRDVPSPAIVIDVREGEHEWELVYSDNGVGVPLDLQPRIFEPFFTTRRGRGGTGLGLNIVYTVVTQRMGGHLDFWSRPGEGVRLNLKLPRLLMSERSDSQPQTHTAP
ncbi:MAG: HAMP domain-containing sensor histidine kinase [Hydrogenophaga sp.]|nr:HAMP domain-containing sensor histidine kinase [Hydrogenophaga sp.]